MKAQTYFHIPTPCHENWDNMTPEGKGRFCASCSKQVIDFSLMSDQQVLNYFKNTTGKVCGRFADDQLQRPIVAAAEQKKKVWWVATMMPMLILFGKVNAQKKKGKITLGTPAMIVPDKRPEIMGKVAPGIRPVIDTAEQVVVKENCWRTMGDTMLTIAPDYLKIKGKVTDRETGSTLPGASIFIKGTNTGVAADVDGNFFLSVKNGQQLPAIIISYVGYESKEIDLNTQNTEALLLASEKGSREVIVRSEMTMLQPALMGDVVITAGVVVTCRKPKKADSLKTTVNKIFRREPFKIFPNPAQSGSSVNIEIHKAGNYSMQLLDNNAKLILVKKMEIENDKTLTEITLPYDIIPGMYYIVLIDENKKKQYTDKLIVQ